VWQIEEGSEFEMDFWDDCNLIERVPGKMSGEPVIKETRVLAQTIVAD
jgi:uncharacterized protein (DUF433 family)